MKKLLLMLALSSSATFANQYEEFGISGIYAGKLIEKIGKYEGKKRAEAFKANLEIHIEMERFLLDAIGDFWDECETDIIKEEYIKFLDDIEKYVK